MLRARFQGRLIMRSCHAGKQDSRADTHPQFEALVKMNEALTRIANEMCVEVSPRRPLALSVSLGLQHDSAVASVSRSSSAASCQIVLPSPLLFLTLVVLRRAGPKRVCDVVVPSRYPQPLNPPALPSELLVSSKPPVT